MVYFPSMLEFGVVLGVFGLGALMLLLGLKFLPLKPTAAFALDTIRFSAGRLNHRAPRRATWRGGGTRC